MSVGDVPSATSLREQDAIVYDPTDVAAKRYKFYFSAVIGGVSRIWRTTSPDGTTWAAPVACVMGVGDNNGEDPSVCTKLSNRGEVYRDGNGKMYVYTEHAVSGAIYGYSSTDGITFTELAGNPVIPLGAAAEWDEFLTGSPCARHNGSVFIVGYEGIAKVGGVGGNEGFGIVTGADPAVLTKRGQVWDPTASAVIGNSIVVDSFFLNDAGTKYILTAHDGKSSGAWMFRGVTTNLDPTTWVAGDITQLTSQVKFDGTLRNDWTLDNSSGLTQIITAPADDLSFVKRTLLTI